MPSAADNVHTAGLSKGNQDSYTEPEPTISEWIKSTIPTQTQVISYIASLFPFSRWITSYNLQWLAGDLVAGVTVGAVVIPQGMAYAKLAQLPVQFGLYSSFMGALVYWIFGTSKDINIGPVAVASIVTASIVGEARNQLPDIEPFVLASALAFLSGAVICLVGLLRLGWIVDLISLAAVSAFITGSAITIVSDQVSVLLGIRGISTKDPAYLVAIHTLKHLGSVRLDAAMGVSALVLLYIIRSACNFASERYPAKKKLYFFLSTLRTIFVILLFTMISWLVNRSHRTKPKFSILGHIPRGFRKTTVPDLDARVIKVLAGQIPAMIIVLLIEHISIAKSFGRVSNYTIDPSQELIAIGTTNMLGPFLGAYASTGSASRTAIKSKCGVRTPFAGVITAGVVLLAIYTLTPVFFYVPAASLAGVIIHAVGDLVTPPSTIKQYWKISPIDVLIFFTGVIITVFDSIETGVFATMFMSVAVLLYRIFRSRGRMLGKARVSSRIMEDEDQTQQTGPGNSSAVKFAQQHNGANLGTDRSVFLPLDRSDGTNPLVRVKPTTGVFAYRLLDGLNYQNANHQLDHMVELIFQEARPTTTVTFTKPGDRSWNDPSFRRGLRAQQSSATDQRPTLKAVVLDFSTVNNVDLTAVQVLIDVRNQLDRFAAPDTVQWHFASVNNRWTKRALVAAGFGRPTPTSLDRSAALRQRISTVAELDDADSEVVATAKPTIEQCKDIELGVLPDPDEIIGKGKSMVTTTSLSPSQVGVVSGVNFPFFHVDLESALQSASLLGRAEGPF